MKIKECPFCGGKPKHVADMGDHWIICGCGAVGATRLSEENAIRFWNTRASITAVQGDVEPPCPNWQYTGDNEGFCNKIGCAIRTP
ncbi:MAG: Lar family restriction alleviation protein [Desulfobacteraceae bacterium]